MTCSFCSYYSQGSTELWIKGVVRQSPSTLVKLRQIGDISFHHLTLRSHDIGSRNANVIEGFGNDLLRKGDELPIDSI